GLTIGGGGGGAGYDRSGGTGGGAAGAIYNSGALTIIGASAITNNIAAGGGGGAAGGSGNNAGVGGRAVGAIWNATGGTVSMTAASYAAIANNVAVSGNVGGVNSLVGGASNTALPAQAAVAKIYNQSGVATNVNTALVVAPVVTDANVSISGATGTGGAYKIGDTVTATWNNGTTGDNNTGITAGGVTMDFSAFGGGSAVVTTLSGSTYSATYTITAGALDATGRNVSVSASNGTTTTTADTTNATVDNVAPAVNAANITISGATGTSGAYRIGDVVTATWTDGNTDTISGATADFSAFGGGSAVAASKVGGVWSASYTIAAGAVDGTARNVSFTATDNAGNATNAAGTSNATVDNIAPVVTTTDIVLSGATGTGGAYKIGDTVTASWTDSNTDSIVAATVNFSQFGGGTAAATLSGSTWSASHTITAANIDTVNRNVAVSATDNAGNVTTRVGTSNVTLDRFAPVVTAANIALTSTGSGSGGAYRPGDTVSATWTNTGGDANTDTLAAVTFDFSRFGGGIVTPTLAAGVYSASYVTVAGITDATDGAVIVTATDNAGNVTGTLDDTSAVVDLQAPVVTDANLSISGASGAGGTYVAGDTVTATWNSTADGNGDTLSAVTVDFSAFGGGAAVAAADSGGIWTASFTIEAGAGDATGLNVSLSATDNAGNTTTGADSSNAALDASAPTLAIVVAHDALTAGETSLVTFTFSEPVSGFSNADLSVANGTLSAVTSVDGGTTWTATLTPDAGVASATNLITVNNAALTDTAGNAGSGSTDSNAYSVMTAGITAAIVFSDNALLAGETSSVTITFSEAVVGFDNADLTVENGTFDAVTSSDGGTTWNATLTPTPGLVDASNVITLDLSGVTDAGSTAGVGTTTSENYAIDTAVASVSIALADDTLTAGGSTVVTFTFSEPVSGFDNGDVTVENGFLDTLATSDGGTTWSATLTATASTDAPANMISVDNAGFQNASGNAGAGSTTASYAIDVTAPTVDIAFDRTTFAIGDTAQVTFTFSEPVVFGNSAVSVDNGSLSDVSSADGGTTWSATFSPAFGVEDASGVLLVDNTLYADLAGNAGSGTTTSANYAVDTAMPTVGIVVADSVLTAGGASTVTFTFSEAVTGFSNANVAADNATIGTVGSLDGGTTWTATLTPDQGVDATGNVVSLTMGAVADLAGNTSNYDGAYYSGNYVVSTVRPGATITLADDLLTAGESTLVTIAFSEAVSGLDAGDLTASNGTLDGLATDDGGLTWTATYTPNAGADSVDNAIMLDNTGVADADGNTGTGTTYSAEFTIDQAAPTVVITLAETLLAGGESMLVTFTFSEAVTGLDIGDFTAENGTLSELTSGGEGRTWTLSFTATAGVDDTGNVITLDNTLYTDSAGNAGGGSSASGNFEIDSTAPTFTIDVADASLQAGESTLVTITFNEPATYFDNSHMVVPNGTLSTLTSGDGGLTWTATYTPDAGVSDTSNVISLDRFWPEDMAGNYTSPQGTQIVDSNNFAIDTAPPTATITLDTRILAAGGASLVTIAFSEVVADFDNGDLSAANGTLGAVSSGDGGLTWTATFTPDSGITVASSVITLDNTGVLDLAGNAGGGATISEDYAIDTERPSVSITLDDTDLIAGESALVTFTFSEVVTGFSNASVTVANGTLDAVTAAGDGITWTAIFTPDDGITAASNLITVDETAQADLYGNTGAATSVSGNFTIDTERPDVGVTVGDTALRAGKTTTVTFTFTEPVTGFSNANVSIDNGTLDSFASLDGGTTWTATFTPTADIEANSNISYEFSTLSDLAGNASSISFGSSEGFAIDTLLPSATILVADDALAAGESTQVTFTFSEPVADLSNSAISVTNGVLGAATSIDGGITWSATFTPDAGVTAGANLITLDNTAVTDLAGNPGLGETDSNSFAIDTAAPIVAITIDDSALAAGESALVTFTFSEAVTGFSNSAIKVANGTLDAVSSVDGGTTWTATFTPTAGVTSASNVITVDNTLVADLIGNPGDGATASANFTIDSELPTVSIALADSALSAGQSSLVTFTFSEPVTGFSNANVSIDN
ncbi:Ig-like domain-containing protein, partial [Massilia glaciei]